MTQYAQTNLELVDQLRGRGYGQAELRLVGDAYALAARLTSGLFRPSGKTFLAHLVGTASILAAHGAPVEVTVAGLLHAAYQHGDFGGVRSGATRHNRSVLQHEVGPEVERWVYAYERFPWRKGTIDRLHQGDLSEEESVLAFMRLANELEDHLDLGILYTSTFEGRRRSAEKNGPKLVDLARKIGHSALAAELERELLATTRADPLEFGEVRTAEPTSWQLLPAGVRPKMLLSIARTPGVWWRRLRKEVDKSRLVRKARRAQDRLIRFIPRRPGR